jgi:hypothetical protein
VAVEKNIEAFASLDLPGTKVVIGDGPQREELAEKYPDVKFLGAKFGDELARYFGCADVFCFPSLTDTFGLVILEAMAAGVPVAAFSAPGPIDIIPGSNAGVLAPGQTDGLKRGLPGLPGPRPRTWSASSPRSSRGAPAPRSSSSNLQPYPEPEKTRFWRPPAAPGAARRRPPSPALAASPADRRRSTGRRPGRDDRVPSAVHHAQRRAVELEAHLAASRRSSGASAGSRSAPGPARRPRRRARRRAAPPRRRRGAAVGDVDRDDLGLAGLDLGARSEPSACHR